METPPSLALMLTNHELRRALHAALAGVTDAHMHYRTPVLDERSLCEVAIHAYRPVLAVVAVVVGQPWPPRPALPQTVPELATLLDAMHGRIDQWLAAVPDEVLAQPVTVRWGSYATGIHAIAGSLAHGLVHTGVIRGIRALGGFPCPPDAA